jgi:hypothetical protein
MAEQALNRYISAFLDSERMSVHTYIMLEKLRRTKGLRSNGYVLWDYYATDRKRRPYVISENTLKSYSHRINEVLVYWDCTYVAPSSPFSAHNGVCMAQYKEIAAHLDICPPTLYLFDRNYQWSLVRTDEAQNEEDWNCLQIGEIGSAPRRKAATPAYPAVSAESDNRSPSVPDADSNLIILPRKQVELV